MGLIDSLISKKVYKFGLWVYISDSLVKQEGRKAMAKSLLHYSNDPNILIINGGRERSVIIKLVPSNYNEAELDEMLINISGPVSLDTLEKIIKWAKEYKYSYNCHGEKILFGRE